MSESYDWRPAFELLLEETRRSVDRQMTSVREARQRVGNLLGYASVTAAALGFTASGHLGLFGWLAVIAYVVVSIAALAVLYPRKFQQDLGFDKIDDWFENPDNSGVDHMLRSAAAAHGENYNHNALTVLWLHRGIMVAVGGLVVETIALVLRLVL